MDTNWTTKEEYLQFVQDWKCNYKSLSEVIRGSRLDRRIEQSKAARGTRYKQVSRAQLDARAAERAKVTKALTGELGAFWDFSEKATELLLIRQAEKERAGLAREASLAVLKAA